MKIQMLNTSAMTGEIATVFQGGRQVARLKPGDIFDVDIPEGQLQELLFMPSATEEEQAASTPVIPMEVVLMRRQQQG